MTKSTDTCHEVFSFQEQKIDRLYFSEKSNIAFEPKTPIENYDFKGDNSNAINEWKDKMTFDYVDIEFAYITNVETVIQLHKGKSSSLGCTWSLKFKSNKMLPKNIHHFWFENQSGLFGGENGVFCDLVKLNRLNYILTWHAKADPPFDAKHQTQS